MKLKTLLLLGTIILLCSCGTKKIAVSGKNLSMKQIIKNHEEAAPNFETMAGKVRASYADENTTQNITLSIRMEKDSAIWLSAKLAGIIPLAKALITPNEVNYYEKINKTYFVGDFRLLGQWLGMELDYEKVQNLLVGQAIYNLNKEDYVLEKTESGLQFESEGKNLLKKLFLLSPRTFKAEAQQLVREAQNQSLTVTYPEYQQTPAGFFPKKISIVAIQEKKNAKIDIEYRSLDFDVEVSFPFDIPAGYEEIEL